MKSNLNRPSTFHFGIIRKKWTILLTILTSYIWTSLLTLLGENKQKIARHIPHGQAELARKTIYVYMKCD